INLFLMTYSVKRILNISTFYLVIISLLIYFRIWVDPILIEFEQQPIFLFKIKFLSDYLVFPGGLSEYLSLFISQFFHYGIPGTLIIVMMIYLIVLLTRRLLSVFFPADIVFVLQFLPLLFLTHLHSQYSHTLRPDIVIIVSILLTLGYNYFINKSFLFRISAFILCSVFLAFLFGGISLMLFSLLVILLEIKNRKNKYIQLVIVYVAVSSILPFLIGLHSPYMTVEKTFFDMLLPDRNYKPYVTLYSFFLLYPVFILAGIFISNATRVSNYFNEMNRGKSLGTAIIQTVLPVVLLLFTLKSSYNNYDKVFVEFNYYAEQEDWQSVIEKGEILSHEDRLVLFQLNRALYHSGRLTDDLFGYRQIWGQDGLILTRYYNSRILMPISDYYFDLGFVKESLHWAYEALTKYELEPLVLKRIALSNLILGEYKISEKFLKILSKSVIHKSWANKYLKYLDNEDLVESDIFIREKRDLMPKHDYYAHNDEPEIDLYNLLEENVKNKMAFEYFIANSLLKHNIGIVIKSLYYLPELNYSKIPRHIEEAILIYILFQNGEDIQLKPYQISELTKENFNRYNYILYNKHNNNLKAAKRDLSKYFSKTYWYYLHYVSPITTKKEIKERSME
ncbi:MAG: hypothetical protein JSV22_02925, partial [Bacteroidales bacterium]